MKNEKMPAASRKKTVSRVLEYLGTQKKWFFLSLLLSVVYVAFTLLIPVFIGNAIDAISDEGVNKKEILYWLKISGILIPSAALLKWIISSINNKITFEVVRDVRRDASEHINLLPLSYVDSHPAGDIVSRIIADADQFAEGLLLGFTEFFTGILTIFGTFLFMLRIRPGITLLVVGLTPLSLFVAKFVTGHTHAMFKLQSKTRGEQTALIEEMIGNQKVVQAFAREKESLEMFDEVNDRLEDCAMKATFFSSLTNPGTRFVNNVVYAVVTLFGSFSVIGGHMTVGGLSCFLSYAGQFAKPFNEISGVLTELQNALACAERIFDFLDSPVRTPDAPDAIHLDRAEGRVELSNMSFSYTPDRPLMTGLNLSVPAGKRIAIVGPTGCGKTTLINLLLRFYDPTDGSIQIDGYDTRILERAALRRNIGMVLQDTWLMEGTIRDNISMGKPDAALEEIEAAAKACHAHSFIKRLPQGYETFLPENGGDLSQGQKQLLSIARVMLCLPPILILDEATSSIDTRTELKVQDAFAKMMRGRTSFIVAHRLSTIVDADWILVMKDGTIIEQGTHETLLKAGGFYHKLYNSFTPE